MSGKLQKSETAARQVSAEQRLDRSRKPLPNVPTHPRTVPIPSLQQSPSLPAVGAPDASKRHSSYEWRDGPQAESRRSDENKLLQRPFAQDGTLQVARLRPSASASNLGNTHAAHAFAPAPATLQKEPKDEKKKKGGWFSSGKDKKDDGKPPAAWIIAPGQHQRVPFDIDSLQAGRAATDLWDPQGNCFIHLFPESSGKGASFRVDSSVLAASATLTQKAFGKLYTEVEGARKLPTRVNGVQEAPNPHASQTSATRSARPSLDAPQNEVHLFLDLPFNGHAAPITPKKSLQTLLSDDAETLVGVRNLFAFLCGQALVATERYHTVYSIFMAIANLLQRYDFTNMDGSSFGEVAVTSFNSYVLELGMADVRRSALKNVEMIVLGERMRSVALYNEAFSHAVGRNTEIRSSPSAPAKQISQVTQTRLSRAVMDLEKKKQHVELQLSSFEFPSIFSGIMSSKTADERRSVNFDAWRSSFLKMRSFFHNYYKDLFGSWPPKPHPKKNSLQTGGLNRIVLLTLYNDSAALYDLLADRQDLTNRTTDGILKEEHAQETPRVRALRHILSEYDRSSPPVKPPVPFDLPKLPDIHALRPDFGTDKQRDLKLINKSLKGEEVLTILRASHNSDVPPMPFIQAFHEFERSQAKGDSIQEIAALRDGQWIFLYAVLQLLPLLVVDAPGLIHTENVEYFLCQASRGGVPWARAGGERGASSQTWYGVAGGASMVSLPSDVIEHSIDAVYRRSHCWQMAERWTRNNPLLNAAVHEQQIASAPHCHGLNSSAPSRSGVPGTPQSRSLQGSPAFNPSPASHIPNPGELLMPPPTIPAAKGEHRADSRSNSPSRVKRGSVLDLGLEALPMPGGIHPEGRRASAASFAPSGPSVGGSVAADSPRVRPVSTHVNDPSITFDAILADVSPAKGKKDKKKK